SVGKCDHQNSCNYHLPPREFFQAHPDLAAATGQWRNPDAKSSTAAQLPTFIPRSLLPRLADEGEPSDNLLRYFVSQFGREDAYSVFHRYHVGPSKHWIYQGGCATAFPQIDPQGRVCQVKVIAYNPVTGHRLHEEDAAQVWSERRSTYFIDKKYAKVWFAGKSLVGNPNATLRQTYFGAHLLPQRPRAEVCLCESEKTAMVASLRLDGVWLATGGKNGCRWADPQVSAILRGRRVTLYPDLGCLEQWEQGAASLRRQGVDAHISRYIEENASQAERSHGLDIADFLLNPP
ncbi:MAG: DUF6371 domain-containing protein, partial [Prevotellaceae bacterium]|nr:DUF6371 domain-containing protein [Prevotellaceae bacterium]